MSDLDSLLRELSTNGKVKPVVEAIGLLRDRRVIPTLVNYIRWFERPEDDCALHALTSIDPEWRQSEEVQSLIPSLVVSLTGPRDTRKQAHHKLMVFGWQPATDDERARLAASVFDCSKDELPCATYELCANGVSCLTAELVAPLLEILQHEEDNFGRILYSIENLLKESACQVSLEALHSVTALKDTYKIRYLWEDDYSDRYFFVDCCSTKGYARAELHRRHEAPLAAARETARIEREQVAWAEVGCPECQGTGRRTKKGIGCGEPCRNCKPDGTAK